MPPRFHDALASYKGEDGSVNLPDDWETGLTTAYDDDFAEAGELSTAKIAEQTAQVADLQAQLTAAKAANWDLLQSVAADDTGADTDPGDSANQADAPDPENPTDFDGFFGEAK
jgi:hypothetical protein